jgi:hypothetical protein
MRAAGIETFRGEVQLLELAAPQSRAPDEVVIACGRPESSTGTRSSGQVPGMSAAGRRWCSGSRRPASSSPLAKR